MTESRNCLACGTPFYRTTEIPSNWARKVYCTKKCGRRYAGMIYDGTKRKTPRILKRSYVMPVTVTGKYMPTRAVSPGQRMRWLRLSESDCGRKVQVSIDYVSHKTGLTVEEITDLEVGESAGIMSEVHRMVCKVMKWPAKLLTVDDSVWLEEVRRARLTSRPENQKF